MKKRLLYAGDTSLDHQAAYLSSLMNRYHFEYDYLASNQPFPDSCMKKEYALVVLSDYPASNFEAEQMRQMAERVRDGMSLCMIGGWESFTGAGGDYHRTPLADVLPVAMKSSDDRVNLSRPCLVIREQSHAILNALPYDQEIPAIGGLNDLEVKPGATLLLSAVEFKARNNGSVIEFNEGLKYPLLVVGRYGLGRTAAYASDVAPHWVGPFVDWGDRRLKARADGSRTVEVGNWYAEFFVNLLRWLCVDYEKAIFD